ncbi:MAG: sporulation integral membrane protein YlbJ [Christensenellales bacterium]|jgi:sporulation integral membrane protein YlbJ
MRKTIQILCAAFLLLLVLFPEQCLQAGQIGITLFFETVFPSLLPFFIGSALLVKTGALNSFSRLLEPLMRPLFRCPGDSAYVFAMSIVSGYPVGAKLVSSLVMDGRMTRSEGLRTLCFSSTSGPLFLMGSIAAGMLRTPAYGVILLLAHYISALLCGLIARFAIRDAVSVEQTSVQPRTNKQPFGMLLKASVSDSVQTLLVVGGYIILFSIIIRLLGEIRFLEFLGFLLKPILSLLGFSASFAEPFASGLVEMTTGVSLISAVGAPMAHKAILISFIVSFSGLCIHSQTSAFLSTAGIPNGRYMLIKLLHGVLAAFLCFALSSLLSTAQTAFAPLEPGFDAWGAFFWPSLVVALAVCASMLLILCAYSLFKKKRLLRR